MISTLSSEFTLSLYSPTDARVLEAMYEVSLDLAGPTDDLGQLTTLRGAIDHSAIAQIWEEHLLLRVPTSRCPEGRATAPEMLAAFIPATRSMFGLAMWVGNTMAEHEWLEGPQVDSFSGNLACGFNVAVVRTTLLTSVTVGRAAPATHRWMRRVFDRATIAIADLATGRQPWISYQV